ncbi:MAG: hypothetical protein ABDI20_01785 [Candidatus Bipolaricaulaceae bacterium]
MQVSLFRLTFPSGFHLAPHEVALDETLPTIPSDTLFSALVQAWIRAGGDPQAWLAPFTAGDPPFLLTSAFPWIREKVKENGQEKVREGPWFPKPMPLRPSPEWKEVPFLPEDVFVRLARGEPAGKPPAWPPSAEKPWEIEEIPRVSLDRITLRSNLFHIARVHFREGCGLWFGVAWLDPERPCGGQSFRSALELALTALAETGLGGDRSVGYGRFHWEPVGEATWPQPKPEGFGVLLSRLWPLAQEFERLRRAVAWRFTEVGGFAETAAGHVRRKRVRLVVEGSVVPGELRGGLADLTPADSLPHRVWRYGLALLYPWEVAHAA